MVRRKRGHDLWGLVYGSRHVENFRNESVAPSLPFVWILLIVTDKDGWV